MFNVWTLIAACLAANVVVEGQRCSGSRCGDCLINEGCMWCKDRTFNSQRCGSFLEIKGYGCKYIVQRKNHTVEILENKDFSDGGPGLDPIQIKPQRIKIKLVPNSALRYLMIHYKVARNFPLDLYFLQDPSKSMENLITSLTQLTNDIANEISNLTTDFRFGFGTAIDKVIAPFTRRDPKYLLYPCGSTYLYCDHPYSFLHRQSLTADIDAFKVALGKVNRTGNQDKVEGLFDGLMQVMVCGDKIGWRKKARRIVVYATDVNFHQAGDGRTAGILEPNDCLCHLDDTGKYTKAEIQDYPSVGQIIQKARENDVNVIFVIGGNESSVMRANYYDELARQLPGAINNASALSNDSKNIIDIIRENYRSLRETVKLLTDRVPDELFLIIYSDCRTTGICSNAGNCTCSKCDCFEGYSGQRCECNDMTCSSHNGRLCGGPAHGNCSCGKCVCTSEYSGAVCDCQRSEKTCRNQNGTICSNHGVCECGKCSCDVGFRGDLCDTCLTCPDLCEGHFNCVECVGFKQGPFNDTMCKERCENVEIVPILYDKG